MKVYSNVSIMVRTKDLELFKNKLNNCYNSIFNSNKIKHRITFDKYQSYLEYQLKDTNEIVSSNEHLTLITFNCVEWNDNLDYVNSVWQFLDNLDYFEMLIINDDYTTDYYADDYTRKFVGEGGTLLCPEIKVNVVNA